MNFLVRFLLFSVFSSFCLCENDMTAFGDVSSFADVLDGGKIDDSEIGFEDDRNMAKHYGGAVNEPQSEPKETPDSLNLPFAKLVKPKTLSNIIDSQQQKQRQVGDGSYQGHQKNAFQRGVQQQQQQQPHHQQQQQKPMPSKQADVQPQQKIYPLPLQQIPQQNQHRPQQQYQQQQQRQSEAQMYQESPQIPSLVQSYDTAPKYKPIVTKNIQQTADRFQDNYDTSYKNIGLNAFGRPGIDFPIYATVPKTDFKCQDQQYPGYYADTEADCQVFHICQADGRQNGFLCPNATLFNQMTFVCEWYFNVDCNSAKSYYSLNANLYEVKKDKYTTAYQKTSEQQKFDSFSV